MGRLPEELTSAGDLAPLLPHFNEVPILRPLALGNVWPLSPFTSPAAAVLARFFQQEAVRMFARFPSAGLAMLFAWSLASAQSLDGPAPPSLPARPAADATAPAANS